VLVYVIAAVVVIGALVVAFMAVRRRAEAQGDKQASIKEEPAASSLLYPVPPGQDPALLVSTLESHGYPAVAELDGAGQTLHISCPDDRDRDRERVRRLIEGVDTTAIDAGRPMQEHRVRFRDEV
jgi:hypothetical protein